LRSPQQQPPSPSKKGKKGARAQTAGQSPERRAPTATTTSHVKTVSVSSVVSGPISKSYEVRGLTEIQVENEHLRTVDVEVKRERTVTQSVQEDNAMLRTQLGTANERIRGLEKVRKEQAENITQLEKVRD